MNEEIGIMIGWPLPVSKRLLLILVTGATMVNLIVENW